MSFIVGGGNASIGSQVQLVNAFGTLRYDYGPVDNRTLRVASQLGNAAGAADFNLGAASAQTLRTVLASDQSSGELAQELTLQALADASETPGNPSPARILAVGGQNAGSILPFLVDPLGRILLEAVLRNDFGAIADALRVAAQVGNSTGPADFGAGNASAQTLRAVIATDQPPVPTSAPLNPNTSPGTNSSVGLVAQTEIAPADAVGFFLSASNSNNNNIFWSITGTATINSNPLEGSRDTGFIPAGANISLIADAAAQNYTLTWIRR